MADPLFVTPLEQPLSYVAWQALIHPHSVYAQRRYRYHTRLVAYGYTEFVPSLIAFQQITNRAANHSTARAHALLQQALANPHFEASIVWTLITDQLYNHAHSIDDVASLPKLCAIITRNMKILESQQKPLNSASNSSAEWETILLALAVLMEEWEIAKQTTLPLSNANKELLAPYPDAAAWQVLLDSNPHAATERFSTLLLQQAQVASRLEFNALESMAIYRMLRNQ